MINLTDAESRARHCIEINKVHLEKAVTFIQQQSKFPSKKLNLAYDDPFCSRKSALPFSVSVNTHIAYLLSNRQS